MAGVGRKPGVHVGYEKLWRERLLSISNMPVTVELALFLYFAAGLLPDPDGPFRPSGSHSAGWLLAIFFEITIAVLLIVDPRMNGGIMIVAFVLTMLRALTLMVMVLLYHLASTRFSRLLEFGSDAEQESLIPGDSQSHGYGSKAPPGTSRPSGDAQSSGWLDYFAGFKNLVPYLWPSHSRKLQAVMIVCFILLGLQRLMNVLVPYQLGVLVESLGFGVLPYHAIALYCLYRGLQGQQGMIGSVRAVLWVPISQSLYKRLTCAAYEHVLLLSLDFHLSKKVGEVVSALGKGGSLNTFLDGFAFQLFPMVFDLGVAAVYLGVNFDAFYSIIVIGVMWSYTFVTIYMAKYRGRARRDMALKAREMDAAKNETIAAYETVHHNGALAAETTRFHSLTSLFQISEYSVLMSLNALNAMQNVIFVTGIILISSLSAYHISIGVHKISEFVTLIVYFAQLQAPLAFFGSFYTMVQNNLIDAERMLDLFNRKPEVVDRPGARPLTECAGQVSFSHVEFSYSGRPPALKNITFNIPPGTSAAIVGESGSGKSTLLKLLFRFYDVDKGTVAIDGTNVRDLTILSVRDVIGIVPQDTVLFNNTLMYNLLYSAPNANEETVFAACKSASIHDQILSFPEGYETLVGERGLKLSGGERQRVAIARALLKEPRIMLLDEATASMDTNTENLIQKALDKIKRDRVTITIAHRLSTITRSDQIFVLHQGEIVERGRHADLLATKGRYASMWEKQAETAKSVSAN